jgi:uncharacterized protein YndB with AHSA1/START domain
MGHAFESSEVHAFDAAVEDVWRAIATGPGFDSWFLGRTSIEPRVGGSVTTDMGPARMEAEVTACEPLRRFAIRGDEDASGRFVAYEFLIEGRDQGSTVLRMTTSGFLPGDDWEEEFDAMTKGGQMFFATLVAYLSHFPGQFAVPVTASGPPIEDWSAGWAALAVALGLTRRPSVGDVASFSDAVLGRFDAVVDFSTDHALGLRSSDALLRFVRGFHSGGIVTAHHLFGSGAASETATAQWIGWLNRLPVR